MCPIIMWASCILAVSFDGTIMQMSHNSAIFPPFPPVKPTENIFLSLLVFIAFTMFSEFPEVDMPTKISPSQPCAAICLEKKKQNL